MTKNLVIVESPAKAKTIEKYLGSEFKILASYGHVRDLIPKKGSVDPDHDFEMKYQRIDKNSKYLDKIFGAIKKAKALYLATDPDREGEAIAWHVYELLRLDELLKEKPVYRIAFHEITQAAIQNALVHPRSLSMDLINSQQARRALDYLVGFNLSPLLWKKIQRGLSAGRVQSPALRLIVEREEEISRFVSREYWTLSAHLRAHEQSFEAQLIKYEGKKLSQFSLTEVQKAQEVRQNLQQVAHGELEVVQVKKKQRKRNPPPPFITSTLQQEAAHKLGFSAQKTMRIAQVLYEGLDVGQGLMGLITYMRTDSVYLADEALQAIRVFIKEQYGLEVLPPKPNRFRNKSKNAQEAHEAIRPTHIHVVPEQVKTYLTAEQFKLYDLIWKRTLASQMVYATLNILTIELSCGAGNIFRASGSSLAHPGFTVIYTIEPDETVHNKRPEMPLPSLQQGEKVLLHDVVAQQHFTEPPARYSEATLIKTLEEYGIGRPSTYVPILLTLQQREYVWLENKRFKPTDRGIIVNKFLTNYFTSYVDYHFTAKLEDELDAVSRGEKLWKLLLREFWAPFKERVIDIESRVQRQDVTQEILEEPCPQCGKSLSMRLGKRGKFIGCTGYPACNYTRNVAAENSEKDPVSSEVLDRQCPQCVGALQVKYGRYGQFIGCSGYPTCKYMEPLTKPQDTEVVCPECSKGTLLKRRSRQGKIFYSCAMYPACRYAVWNQPLTNPCPVCAWPITTVKILKSQKVEKVCPRPGCTYVEPVVSWPE